MGDFADVLKAVPEFTRPGLRETFVDAIGLEIMRVTPLDGAPALYFSLVRVQTMQGPMGVNFQINDVASIEAAAAAWQASARAALTQFGEKMRENQRRIVLPDNPAANSAPFKRIIN